MTQDIRCTIHDSDIPCAKCLATNNPDSKQEALKPCRFCGKEAKGFWDGPYLHVSGPPDGLHFYSVVCNGCCSTASYESKERAVEKWNSRASVAAVEVKRFSHTYEDGIWCMDERVDGKWVHYTDHERIIKSLEAHIADRDALLSPSPAAVSEGEQE